MTHKSCGCATETCGCCEGVRVLTPASEFNRPGLPAIRYRAGTHGAFLETMKARLSSMTVDAPGADGQTIETFRPLDGLTIRSSDDASIALLDGWAAVGDVLTFYQERIANEGYLRTATERRSILELARLVGYEPRPGVAATVYLAYTLEDKQVDPVEIPEGSRAQSIPGPGELPQSFETSEKIIARNVWNNLQVRLSRPQNISYSTAPFVKKLFVSGTTTDLKTGDPLLFVFDTQGTQFAIRTVEKIEADFTANRTAIFLHPSVDIPEAYPLLTKFIAQATPLVPASDMVLERANQIVAAIYQSLIVPPAQTWADDMENYADGEVDPAIETLFQTFTDDLGNVTGGTQSGGPVTDPKQFVPKLLEPPKLQRANSLQLNRSLRESFRRGADTTPQLLVNFAPELKTTYYKALATANVETSDPALKAVYALRTSAPLFGSSVSKMAEFDANNRLTTPDLWKEWSIANDESPDTMYLDQVHDAVLSSSYIVIQRQITSAGMERVLRKVTSAQSTPRTAYGVSGKTTKLALSESWWSPFGEQNSLVAATPDISYGVRTTLVYGQSESLTLIDEPVTNDVDGFSIELGDLYNELTSGRWVIFEGERADIPGVSGVRTAELLMITGLVHGFDSSIPGEKTHTTLQLNTGTAYKYKRDTLTIYGNVVKATHGETRQEILGSGDGSRALQSFALKQPPLTFVPAPTAKGVDSTLHVYVNNVEWHETDTLAMLGPKDRNFITKTDDDAKTTVIFGNGKQGMRLPTGVENVNAIYRQGIGKGGNVLAEQVSLLQSRPLGVKSVINPLRASGGADKEDRDQARENAPLAVMSLDRLVSLQDYTDFTRTFAGIGKADARRLTDGLRELIHITIAGADDIPIDPTSDLYRNLLIALRKLGDPSLPIQVDTRELIALILSANIRLQKDYLWEPVVTEVRAQLLDAFGFHRRALAQPALLCEIIALIQNVEGVAYVDVDAFGGVPEKRNVRDSQNESEMIRRLLTADEIAAAVQLIVDPYQYKQTYLPKTESGPADRVDAGIAQFQDGILQPAQLAIFAPSVADTIVLNQIL